VQGGRDGVVGFGVVGLGVVARRVVGAGDPSAAQAHHSSTHDHEAVVVVEMPYRGLGERGDLLA
jgi:hypothetical protein